MHWNLELFGKFPPLTLSSVQFSHSVMSDSVTPWTIAHQASLSITNSQSLPKLMSIESVMPSNHLTLCHILLLLLLLLPSIFPRIRVFSNESAHGQSVGVSASTSVLLKGCCWIMMPGFLAPRFLAPGGEEFNPGPETRLNHSELLCNKVLLKYKGDRESSDIGIRRGQKEYPPASL